MKEEQSYVTHLGHGGMATRLGVRGMLVKAIQIFHLSVWEAKAGGLCECEATVSYRPALTHNNQQADPEAQLAAPPHQTQTPKEK